jgi:pimeloyl-ACP methyl ester carboxylesterase
MRRVLKWSGLVLFLLVGGLALAGAAYTPSSEIPAGFAGKHISVHGVPLRVWQEGQGPDVLLIHGSPGSVEDWTPIVSALRGEARLTAYDRPGNGFSGVTGEYSLAHNADVALEVIAALGLKDVTVVGHSYGGATALQLAIRAPAVVKAYVIVDSSGYVPGRPVSGLYRLLMVPGIGTGIARALGGKLAAPRIHAGLVDAFNGHEPPPGFVDTRIRIWSNPKVTHTIAAETIGAAEYLPAQSPSYPRIHVPVRIVAQSDTAMRRQNAERLHRDIPGSTLRLLAGTGHYVQVEKPAEVAQEIRAAIAAR